LEAGWPDWANFRPLGDMYFNLDSFLVNYRSRTNLGDIFPLVTVSINSDKNELGYILGNFFTNSFGHPDWKIA
jgi:hypothetical protein